MRTRQPDGTWKDEGPAFSKTTPTNSISKAQRHLNRRRIISALDGLPDEQVNRNLDSLASRFDQISGGFEGRKRS